MLHGFVEGQLVEVFLVDVLEVRDLRMIQVHDHAFPGENFHHVAAGHEDVVAGRSRLQFGEHRLVGVKRVDHHLAVVRRFFVTAGCEEEGGKQCDKNLFHSVEVDVMVDLEVSF